VPYVHVYINNDIYSISATTAKTANIWQTTTFSFTPTNNSVRLYFDAASPTNKKNYLSLDNIICTPAA
jgi:hypothetical protein